MILPAIDYGTALFASQQQAVGVVIVGILTGAVALFVLNRYLPHEHFILGHEGPDIRAIGRIWLFVIAITLHNFPEGMAVGVGFANGDLANGMSLAIGIGIQNIPEGLAVALFSIGYRRKIAFSIAFFTGLAEPIGGLFGSFAAAYAGMMMPFALAFAAGSMLFIISDEIIPETHRRGFEGLATFSMLVGFVLMMYLDVTLG